MATDHERLKTVSSGAPGAKFQKRKKKQQQQHTYIYISVEVTAGSMVIRLKCLQDRMRTKELRKAPTARESERFI